MRCPAARTRALALALENGSPKMSILFLQSLMNGLMLAGLYLVKRTRAMLSAMDAAVVLEDLRFPPGNHLEALKGDRAGQPSIRINDQWRICFVWTEQGPGDVEIVEHH